MFVSCQSFQSSETVNHTNLAQPAPAGKRESGIRRRQSRPPTVAEAAPPAPKRGPGRPRKIQPAAPPAPAAAPVEQPKPPVKAKPRPRPDRRAVNYRSASSPATVRKQIAIRDLLTSAAGREGLTVREIAAHIGISRQLALYHVKKLVALGGAVAELVPSPDNGGVRYLVWDRVSLAEWYVDWLDRSTAPAGRAAA